MLKVSELMLGDWVKIKPNSYMNTYDLDKSGYDPKTRPYIIVKVEQLSDYGINPIERWGDTYWTNVADIDGIELTPEFLIKNEFVENKEFWNGIYQYKFEVRVKNGAKFTLDNGNEAVFDSVVTATIEYITEYNKFKNFNLYVYNVHGCSDVKKLGFYDRPFYVHDIQHMFKIGNVDKKFII